MRLVRGLYYTAFTMLYVRFWNTISNAQDFMHYCGAMPHQYSAYIA